MPVRPLPLAPSSMLPFRASRPRISAASMALRVVSPADSNSSSTVAVIFIAITLCPTEVSSSWPIYPTNSSVSCSSLNVLTSLTLGGSQEGIAWPSTDQATDPRSQTRSRHRRIETTSLEGGRGPCCRPLRPTLTREHRSLIRQHCGYLWVGASRSPLLSFVRSP
jgi:hypothetical protein